MKLSRWAAILFSLWLIWPASLSAQQDQVPVNPITAIRVGQDQKKALKVNDAIFQAIGFGNTFMVTTSEGNVIIDTSMPFNSALHKRLLTAENAGAIKYIILTHAHPDHFGMAGWLAEMSGDALIRAMHQHPKLIERPIVIKNGQARIGRPPEQVLEILAKHEVAAG